MIDFGNIRSKAHDPSTPPEHLMCELSHLLDPSVLGYEERNTESFKQEIMPYLASILSRRARSDIRSFFEVPLELEDLWPHILRGAKHIRCHISPSSYGQRNRCDYARSGASENKDYIGRIIDMCHRSNIEPDGLEIDHLYLRRNSRRHKISRLPEILGSGPLHIALGDHFELVNGSSTSSHIKGSQRDVVEFLVGANTPHRDGYGRYIRALRTCGKSLFDLPFYRTTRDDSIFDAMASDGSTMIGEEGRLAYRKMRENIEELSLIRPVASRFISQHNLSQNISTAFHAMPKLEALEIGVIHVMLDDETSWGSIEELYHIGAREPLELRTIKRLGVVFNCSTTHDKDEKTTARLKEFAVKLCNAVNRSFRESLEFIEIGIMSFVQPSDYPRGMAEAEFSSFRRESALYTANTVMTAFLQSWDHSDKDIRVWVQHTNNNGEPRHLLDPVISVDNGCADARVFSRFEIHPFHYIRSNP
jgi:hypothetical protein